ncbi:class I adenylate-forming enzyme family protein [Geodermatophilus sp. URMC 64]
MVQAYETLQKYTVPELLAALSRHAGDTEAVVGPEGRVTYAELHARCERLARALVGWGLRPGDRIGVYLPNGLRWVVAMLAGHLAGLHVVPINTWYRSSELGYVAHKARIRLFVTDAKLFGRGVSEDLEAAGVDPSFRAGADGSLGTLYWPSDSELPEEIDDAEDGGDPLPGAEPDDIALILFTSGSTANPKPVPLRQGALVRSGRELGARQHIQPGDRIWFAAPLFFGYGCSNALPVALAHAATICIEERVSGDESLAFIERERCTVYYGLATATRMLLSAPSFGRRDISSLRTGTTGFTAEDKRLVIETLGVREVCSVYGMTEAYGHSTMTEAGDPLDVVLTTQGRVLPTQEIRTVDETGAVLPPGQSGEIQLRGCVTTGYLDSPELNEAAFTDDGWFRTGDLGWLDEEQRLHFVGRLKEVMKIKGINISPAEVEEVVAGHARVDQVYVFSVADASGEDVIACVVVPRDPVDDRDAFVAELRAYVRERAASYKVPAQFSIVGNDQLPTTATGKVSKMLLKQQFDGA